MLARQTRPVVVPPDLRRLLQHELVLVVRIEVDATGHILDAYLTSSSGKVETAIWRVYATSLKTWEFEPARRKWPRL